MGRVKPVTVTLDPQVVRGGLRRALVRGLEPVMVIARHESLKFMALSAGRLMISWQHELAGPGVPQYYLMPPLVVSILSSDIVRALDCVTLATGRSGLTVASLRDGEGSFDLRWRAEPELFPTPAEFTYMLAPPRNLIDVSYLDINDAAHRAVAKLLSLESAEVSPRNKLAILVDFTPSRLSIDGQTVEMGVKGRYYFDPRLIIRALDTIHAKQVRVGLTRLPRANRAVLAFLADDHDWHVHCSLLSIGTDTQQLVPLAGPSATAA
jgi:hypothetical protein